MINKEVFVITTLNTYILVDSITIPANCYYTITLRGMYNNAQCLGVVISASNTSYMFSYANNDNESANAGRVHYPSCTYSSLTASGITLYFWGKWYGSNSNSISITGFYIPM